MNNFDMVISELQAARAELKVSNDAAAKRVSKQTTCCCDAYLFPHRKYGGNCYGNLPNNSANCLVSYYHTREAMLEVGHKEGDF